MSRNTGGVESASEIVELIKTALINKANVSDIPTAVSELTNDSGYQTATQVQTAIAGVRQLPTVTASDNGKFLRVVSGAWAAESVSFQSQAITDTGNYYTTDTVEGALQEIGAELAGVNTLIGSGVIT